MQSHESARARARSRIPQVETHTAVISLRVLSSEIREGGDFLENGDVDYTVSHLLVRWGEISVQLRARTRVCLRANMSRRWNGYLTPREAAIASAQGVQKVFPNAACMA